jgi:hypothetical protein
MAKNVAGTATLSRGTKTLAQAFFAAAAETPEASRGEIVKGALVLIRQQIKAANDKAIAAKKKAKAAAVLKKVAAPVKLKAKLASAKTAAPKKATAKPDKKLPMAA